MATMMKGKNLGFGKLMKKDPGVWQLSFHCIVHEENLFAKESTKKINDVMEKFVKL